MAIQFLRGTAEKADSDTHKSKVLAAGQPFFETDTNTLYIGNGETTLERRSGLSKFEDSDKYLSKSVYAMTDSNGSYTTWVRKADIANQSTSATWAAAVKYYSMSECKAVDLGIYYLRLSCTISGSKEWALCIAPLRSRATSWEFPVFKTSNSESFLADTCVRFDASTYQFSATNDWTIELDYSFWTKLASMAITAEG